MRKTYKVESWPNGTVQTLRITGPDHIGYTQACTTCGERVIDVALEYLAITFGPEADFILSPVIRYKDKPPEDELW